MESQRVTRYEEDLTRGAGMSAIEEGESRRRPRRLDQRVGWASARGKGIGGARPQAASTRRGGGKGSGLGLREEVGLRGDVGPQWWVRLSGR